MADLLLTPFGGSWRVAIAFEGPRPSEQLAGCRRIPLTDADAKLPIALLERLYAAQINPTPHDPR